MDNSPISPPLAAPPWPLRPWQELALLGLVPFLLYCGSLGYGFVDPDDHLYFRLNPALHDGGAQGLVELWRAPYLHDYFPVTQLTLWTDLALCGPERLWGARLHALLWFVLGVLAVRALVLRLTGSPPLALAVALLYAVHPVCAHAVLWLSERKNLVCFALAFWSVERYVAARQSDTLRAQWRGLGVAWGLAVLALLAKPHGVVTPVLLAAYEVCLGRGSWRGRAAALAPFVAASAAFLVLSLLHAQGRLEHYHLGGGPVGAFVNDGPIVLRYLGHTVVPAGLAFYYAMPELSPFSSWGWGAWLLVLVLTGGFVAASRQRALLAFGWLLGVAGLSPALNFAPQQLTTMTDQYHQWALPGWLLALSLLGGEGLAWLARLETRKWGLVLTGGVALLFALLAVARVPEYRSPLALAAATVVREPDSALAWARYTRVLAASEVREQHAQAGAAGLRALEAPDADRIQLEERALALTEAAVALYRGGKAPQAEVLLERECVRFEKLPLPYAPLVRAEVAARTGRPGEAVDRLARYFTPGQARAAEQLRAACRDGKRRPDALPPLDAGAPADWPAHEQVIWRDFERRLLLVLAQACLDMGDAERAFDVAAVLVNACPEYAPGGELLAAVYGRLGQLPRGAAER